MDDYREQLPHPHPNAPPPPTPIIVPASFTTTIMAPATARFLPTFNNNNEDTHNSLPDSSKRKRGRPRKHSPDGNIALGLAPTQASSSPPPSSSAKKTRGRPRGSGKKHLRVLGTGGLGFTPHVIFIDIGQDVAAKLLAFSQQGPRAICIMSAQGAVRNVTLRHSAEGGRNVTYEGQYELLRLSGVLELPEVDGGHIRTSGFNVIFANDDGQVLGGGVAGKLIAASIVQVVVGSFVVNFQRHGSNNLNSGPPSMPPSQMLTFGAPVTPTSPTSQGPSTDSSDDNENGTFSKGGELYNSVSQPPVHSMPMYRPQLWASQPQL